MSGDSKNSEISLERMLCLLDRWRHLPAYQLEPRADVFFALLLPAVLGIRDLHLIPQFPIKKSLLPEPRRNDTYQSINVDYLAVSEDLTRSFLIELKTDMMSIKKEQIEDLKFASGKGMVEMMRGIKCIAKCDSVAGNRIVRGKYYHLLRELHELGLIEIDCIEGFRTLMAKERLNHKCYKHCISQIEIGGSIQKVKMDVVYVIPKRPRDDKNISSNRREQMEDWLEDVHQVYFDQLVKFVGSTGARFAEFLKKWKCQAGLCLPE